MSGSLGQPVKDYLLQAWEKYRSKVLCGPVVPTQAVIDHMQQLKLDFDSYLAALDYNTEISSELNRLYQSGMLSGFDITKNNSFSGAYYSSGTTYQSIDGVWQPVYHGDRSVIVLTESKLVAGSNFTGQWNYGDRCNYP